MTTFILKKYEENPEQKAGPTEEQKNEAAKQEALSITVVGSISEIVAKALQKALAKEVDIQEQPDMAPTQTKAISTEDINNAPLDTFRSINPDDTVFIHSEHGFSTAEEEWFLTNLGNKTKNVFYTVESFITHIKKQLNLP